MATLIELNLALQCIQNLSGLQKDMVSNANTHNAMIVAGQPSLATVIQMAQDCATTYKKRLGWVSVITGDSAKLTTLTNGITALGGTMTNANASVTALQNAANAFDTSIKAAVTGADVTTACNTLLAAVPAPTVMF